MKDRDEQNLKHLLNPQPGDYWHEMCTPVCVIVARFRDQIVICETTKDVDGGKRWTWDLDKLKIMSLEEFEESLRYKSKGMRDRTMAFVEPGSHKWVTEIEEKFDPCLMGM